MPWHDWEIAEDDIVIDKRPDGSDWELGAGAFGKVGLLASTGRRQSPAPCSILPVSQLAAAAKLHALDTSVHVMTSGRAHAGTWPSAACEPT